MIKSFFRFLMAIAVFLYRLTNGKFGGRMQGLQVLLLTTTGRKTGKIRTTPLGYFEADGGYIIIGSNAGFDTHPAWFHNLRSNPRAVIRVRDGQFKVNAEIAGKEKRDRFWAQLIELAPGYDSYAKRTRREIPIVILHPITA